MSCCCRKPKERERERAEMGYCWLVRFLYVLCRRGRRCDIKWLTLPRRPRNPAWREREGISGSDLRGLRVQIHLGIMMTTPELCPSRTDGRKGPPSPFFALCQFARSLHFIVLMGVTISDSRSRNRSQRNRRPTAAAKPERVSRPIIKKIAMTDR